MHRGKATVYESVSLTADTTTAARPTAAPRPLAIALANNAQPLEKLPAHRARNSRAPHASISRGAFRSARRKRHSSITACRSRVKSAACSIR